MLNELSFFNNKKILKKSKNLGKKFKFTNFEEHSKKEIIYVAKVKNFFDKKLN